MATSVQTFVAFDGKHQQGICVTVITGQRDAEDGAIITFISGVTNFTETCKRAEDLRDPKTDVVKSESDLRRVQLVGLGETSEERGTNRRRASHERKKRKAPPR